MYISLVLVIFPLVVHVRENFPSTKSMSANVAPIVVAFQLYFFCGEEICGLDFNRYVQGAFFSTGNPQKKIRS